MVNHLHIHSQRDLSLCGKLLLTKSLGISTLIYPISNTVARKLLDRIQTELNRFIWAYKPPKVKHTVLMGTSSQGGLGSIDVKSKYKALRITWIQWIIRVRGCNDIILGYFEPMGGLQFLLQCKYDTADLKWIP